MSATKHSRAERTLGDKQGGGMEGLPVSPAFQLKPYRILLTLVVFAALAGLVGMFATSPNIEWWVFREYFFSERVLRGVAMTLVLTAIAMVFGIILGTLAAFGKMSKIFGFNLLSNMYLWIFRGTPLLVQVLFIFNLGLFLPFIVIGPWEFDTNTLITSMTAAILALVLHEGAYMAEYIRGGILGVSGGQREAALSQGLTGGQALSRIILPQALPSIIPAIGNQTISMLKGTSIVSFIAAAELLTQVQIIYNRNFYIIELLLVACAWYLIMVTIGTWLQGIIERSVGRRAHQVIEGSDSFIARLRSNLTRINREKV